MAKRRSARRSVKKSNVHVCDDDMMCCAKAMLIKAAIILGICWVATKILWDWIVPDIFPAGILAPAISWYTAFKLALVYTACKMMKKYKYKRKYKMMHMMK